VKFDNDKHLVTIVVVAAAIHLFICFRIFHRHHCVLTGKVSFYFLGLASEAHFSRARTLSAGAYEIQIIGILHTFMATQADDERMSTAMQSL
jgi:hypothetical protein